MNLHRERYLAGAAFFVGTIHRRGGRRVAVFDRTIRWKAAAKSLQKDGKSTAVIARVLRKNANEINKVLMFTWRFTA